MSRSVRVAGTLVEGGENIGLHRFALFTVCCTAFLIFVGGLVTSTESGLSVPDWPTTYGWNMFTFPVSKWVGGIFYEHSHRLVASFVGFLTVILAFWTWVSEKRKWVRWLAIGALGAVVSQGILGGLTVKLLLPPAVSSALLRARFLPRPQADVGDAAAFETFLQQAFAKRRKTLENNLRDSYPNLKESLKLLNIAGSRRSETLSVVEFARLWAALRRG